MKKNITNLKQPQSPFSQIEKLELTFILQMLIEQKQDKALHVRLAEKFEFTQNRPQIIWKAISNLAIHGKKIDHTTVARAMGNNIELIGGALFLAEITEDFINTATSLSPEVLLDFIKTELKQPKPVVTGKTEKTTYIPSINIETDIKNRLDALSIKVRFNIRDQIEEFKKET